MERYQPLFESQAREIKAFYVPDTEEFITFSGKEVHAKKAKELWKAERYIEADELYRQAIDCNPEDPQIWNDFGEMNYEAESLNAADTGFSEAIRLDPTNEEAREILDKCV
mgnify:CR=1 FL=1